MKSKDLQPRLLYQARLSFETKGWIKSFPEKKKLKQFINTKPAVLQEILKGFLEEGGGEGGEEEEQEEEEGEGEWEEEEEKEEEEGEEEEEEGGGGEWTEEHS